MSDPQIIDFMRVQFARVHERLDTIDRRLDEYAGRLGRLERSRDLAEASKLREEENNKFVAEQRKLNAEASKLDRERWLAPVLAVAAMVGGLLGVATFIAKIIGG